MSHDVQVIKCPRCGTIFTRERHPICSACWRHEQDNLDHVRRYLDENPHSTVDDVSEGTNVPAKDVVRFIREGYLVAPTGNAIQYPCDACGRLISSGRFCGSCGERLTKGLEGASKRMRKRE